MRLAVNGRLMPPPVEWSVAGRNYQADLKRPPPLAHNARPYTHIDQRGGHEHLADRL